MGGHAKCSCVGVPVGYPGRVMYETVKVKANLESRHQELRDVNKVNCTEKMCWLQKEPMYAATGKTKGVGLLKPFEENNLFASNARGGATELVCLAAFWCLSVPSLLSLFLFGMGMFALYHCILDICHLLLIFRKVHSQEFAFSLRRDFALVIWGNVGQLRLEL